MRYLILLLILAGCTPAPADEPDTKEAAALVAGQIAFYEPAEAVKPSVQTTCKECKGTKQVRSGDGLAMVPCSCGDNCKCERTGQMQVIPQNRMLMFTATWCGSCQIWKRDEVPALKASGWNIGGNSTAEIQYIDYDQNPELVQKYGVMFVPVFVMVRPDGSEIARTGYLSAVEMADFWNRYQEAGE